MSRQSALAYKAKPENRERIRAAHKRFRDKWHNGVTKDPDLPFAKVRSITEETIASGMHVWETQVD